MRVLFIFACAGLFVADYALDIMAKEPPFWTYGLTILLALGVEINPIRCLALRVVEVFARIPNDEDAQKQVVKSRS
ncbi:MAG: hypothetical protein GY945_09100 [Rhodobacteraceae bacterium]|nr:hypothetical protein [Paracoccaceae bacterium]